MALSGRDFSSNPDQPERSRTLAQQQSPAQILRALDEPLEVISYREWDVLFPEGHLSIGGGDGLNGWWEICAVQRRSSNGVTLLRFKPIAAAADALPLLALPPRPRWSGPCRVAVETALHCRRCVISAVPSGLWWIVTCRILSQNWWICFAS